MTGFMCWVYVFIFTLLLVHQAVVASFGQQSDIRFENLPQAQSLWDERDILGDSIYFAHPVSLGTCK